MEPLYIRNVLSDKLFSDFSKYVDSDGWFLSNLSTKKDNESVFWGKDPQEIKNDLFYYKIGSIIRLNLMRIYDNNLMLFNFHVNGQTANQHGEPHSDIRDKNYAITFVLFTSKEWNSLHGGEFIIQNPETKELKYFEYSSNCGILFSSDWKHMGQSPNTKTTRLRTSVAFRYCDSSVYDYLAKEMPKRSWGSSW